MIDNLRAMAIFARVVDLGTFRAAAADLGLAPSRISQTVSDLEQELGVTLMYRSTRRLSLTSEGRVLYAKVSDMLQAAESGLDAIRSLSEEPSGELRVTAPAFVTQTKLADALAGFAKEYKNVDLRLHFSDRPQNLIRDGYDVGIRAGWLEDVGLSSRSIGRIDRLLVASPGYFASKPPPRHPSDLEDWDWVRFEMRPSATELTSPDGVVFVIEEKSRVIVDSADAMYQFAIRGLGLTVVPENLAAVGFQRGELVHVLPNWSARALGLHAIWPDRSRRASLTDVFVRYLTHQLSAAERT